MDPKTLFSIIHLFGVAIGAGGAFMSDAMFFSAVKDGKFSATEIRFLKLGSQMVWMGVVLLLISGALLFSLDPDHYLNSTKFLAKMTVVGVILINGAFFHLVHIPRITRHTGEYFTSSDEFVRTSPILFASGAVSFVSWSSAIVLGVLHQIPYGYGEIMLAYSLILAVAIGLALSLRKRFFSREQ